MKRVMNDLSFFVSVLLLVLVSLNAHGAIIDFTFSAKVKSFDEAQAVCEIDGYKFKIGRAQIKQKKFKTGDLVEITVTGEELRTL